MLPGLLTRRGSLAILWRTQRGANGRSPPKFVATSVSDEEKRPLSASFHNHGWPSVAGQGVFRVSCLPFLRLVRTDDSVASGQNVRCSRGPPLLAAGWRRNQGGPPTTQKEVVEQLASVSVWNVTPGIWSRSYRILSPRGHYEQWNRFSKADVSRQGGSDWLGTSGPTGGRL